MAKITQNKRKVHGPVESEIIKDQTREISKEVKTDISSHNKANLKTQCESIRACQQKCKGLKTSQL